MRKAIVVGSGAGGSMIARELQGSFDVTIVEAGGEYHPFTHGLDAYIRLKRTGLLFTERLISLLYPSLRVHKTSSNIILVRGMGVGGSTTVCAGNGIRGDERLKERGIDLDAEFDSLASAVPLGNDHQNQWTSKTAQAFEICGDMGLEPFPMPKFGDYGRCSGCGRCILGCPTGAKWDCRQFVREAVNAGARLLIRSMAERVVLDDRRARGVVVRSGFRNRFLPADLIVLSAGGIGTPRILQSSGIQCEESLFVDPVLCVSAEIKNSRQMHEPTMPFVVEGDRHLISPYMDFISLLFNDQWRVNPGDMYTLMIKLADDCTGSVEDKGIQKELTEKDAARLSDAVGFCNEILMRLGARRGGIVLGTINAGHPGGCLPLNADQAETLHDPRLPENVYVADATILPGPYGKPPILTIFALARRIASICKR